METLHALVTDITFRNADNGFSVLMVRLDDGRRVAATGIMPEISPGERVTLSSEWVSHAQYGQQLKVSMCTVERPTSITGIERYLGSGAIKGVGISTAKWIVQAFGESSLDVIQFNPDRLTEITGIGLKRARQIAESFAAQSTQRDALVFLEGYGITPGLAMKIAKRYGASTRDIVTHDPYRLAQDIEGIGFITADRIAKSLGIPDNAPSRLRAGLLYALQQASQMEGHCYLPREMLLSQAQALLRIEDAWIDNALLELAIEKAVLQIQLSDELTAVYLPGILRAETETAKRLKMLMEALPYHADPTVQADIVAYEIQTGVALNAQQKRAVGMAVTEGVSIVTGGPGTGKTTIIRFILQLLGRDDVLLAAPTGRAAKRMAEATGHPAATLHRLLEYTGDESHFQRDEDNPLDAKAIIVDEMSMVDIYLMRALLRAVAPGTRLILVGDRDQLPSVGPGNVLSDLLASDVLPLTRLKEIYRQQDGSRIAQNAHRILEGHMPEMNSKGTDFFLERVQTAQEAVETIVTLVTERLPGYLHIAAKDVQVLSPMKKGECGVFALNALLQARLNPESPDKPQRIMGERVYRVGDKVMQMKNDYHLAWKRVDTGEEGEGVFNGDMGFVVAIHPDTRAVTVRFDEERDAQYEDAQLQELELAYCVSVHKSQGSEFPAVVMPCLGGPPRLLTRNLFYTAITRARSMVVLVGGERAISGMVRNIHIARRFTAITHWLTQ